MKEFLKLMKSFVINTSMVIASLMLSLILIEIYLHYFPFPRDTKKPEICTSVDPINLARYKYSIANYSYPANINLPICGEEFFITNKSDEDGYLGASVAKNKHSVLVFGDSFAFGFGVNKEDSFASLIGAYNAGLWGNTFANHAQVLNKLLKNGRTYEMAVWVIYPPHLITASLGSWNSRTQIKKEEHPLFFKIIEQYNNTALSKALLAGLGIGVNAIDYYTREWSLYEKNDRYLDSGYVVFDAAARQINHLALTHHIKIIPLIMPSKRQLALKSDGMRPPFIPSWHKLDADLPTEKILKILQANGFSIEGSVVLIDEILTGSNHVDNWGKLYFLNDAHLNQIGNVYVAKVLCSKDNLKNNLNCS